MKKKLINVMYKNLETGGVRIDNCDADISSLKKIDPKKLAGKIAPNKLKEFDKYFKDNDEGDEQHLSPPPTPSPSEEQSLSSPSTPSPSEEQHLSPPPTPSPSENEISNK